MAGGVIGGILGILLSSLMIHVYRDFFQFPQFLFAIYPDLLLFGLGICIGFAILGALRGLQLVLKLQPAEAMHQTPPEHGGRIILERVTLIWRQLSFRTHMALRSVFRNPIRTGTGIIATALSVAIIFMAMVMYDSFLFMVDYQFDQVAHSDVDIGMRDEQSRDAVFEAASLPGVDRVEPTLGVGCDLQNGPFVRRVSVMGLIPEHQLTTPRIADGTPITIPDTGFVLSSKLAQILNVKAGQTLRFTPVRGQRVSRMVHVAAIADTFIGLSCYADIDYLSSLVDESLAVNGLQLSVDPTKINDLYRHIKQLPIAQNVSARADIRHSLEETLVKTSLVSIGMMILFVGLIALGSTVTNTLIELGDRTREFATLRVLGYHPHQIAGILLRQNIVIFIMGTLLALPLSYGMTLLLSQAYDSELYRMPVVIRPMVVLLTLVFSLFLQGLLSSSCSSRCTG